MAKSLLFPLVAALAVFTYGAVLRVDYDESTGSQDPRCPYPSEDISFFNDPYNCSRYFECYEGDLFIMECYDGLYWNEESLACDYPENVTCRISPTPPTASTITPTVTTAPTPTEDSTTASPSEEPSPTTAPTPTPTSATTPTPTTAPTSSPTEPTPTSSPGPELQCQTAEDGTYIPNVHDCTRFFECVKGKAVPGMCPPGSLWNEDILNCDFAENVHCDYD